MTDTLTLPLFTDKHEHRLIYHSIEAETLPPCPVCGWPKTGLYRYECGCGMSGEAIVCWACYMRKKE